MCVVSFAWQWRPEMPLLIAANRDEYYARASSPLGFWPGTNIAAGRDLAVDVSSTWLGITRTGRFAFLTNVRHPAERRPDAPTRGALVADFLSSLDDPADYINAVAAKARRYNAFNLIVGSVGAMHSDCWALHSLEEAPQRLKPGIYGLSNAKLDTPWPKVRKLVADFTLAAASRAGDATFFKLLADSVPAADHELPQTGVSPEWERALSPVFINTDRYGTRASTVLRVTRGENGTDIRMKERTFRSMDVGDEAPNEPRDHALQFVLEPQPFKTIGIS
jgi:uncharacterized protein with NRDE domain